MKKITFALCFGNRGFMPGELILGARDDMIKAVHEKYKGVKAIDGTPLEFDFVTQELEKMPAGYTLNPPPLPTARRRCSASGKPDSRPEPE